MRNNVTHIIIVRNGKQSHCDAWADKENQVNNRVDYSKHLVSRSPVVVFKLFCGYTYLAAVSRQKRPCSALPGTV